MDMDSNVDQERISALYDAEVRTTDGDRLGQVGQVYLDDETGAPAWVSVRTGASEAGESLVPLVGAEVQEGTIRVAHTRQEVEDAPTVGAGTHLDEDAQHRLFRHYGLVRPQEPARTDAGADDSLARRAELRPEEAVTGASENVAYPSAQDRPEGPVGGPTTGPGTPGRLRRHEGGGPRS